MTYPGHFATTQPDKAAVIMAGSGATMTYRELDERSNRVAHLFRAHGLQRGDHVALFMENQIRFMEVIWGAFRSGLYITAINSFLTGPEAAYVIDDCDARLVVSSRAEAEAAGAIDPAGTPNVERRLMTDDAIDGWESYEEAVAEQPATPIADESQGMYMLYSSGTTGRPKGVKRPLMGEGMDALDPRTERFMIPTYGYGPDTVYLSPAPLYHAAPLAFSHPVHRVGGTLVVMERFEAAEALAHIGRYRVTHSQWVPTMFVRMLKLPAEQRLAADLSTMRTVVHAAAPCPVAVKHQMIDWWGPILYEYYAGSEGNGATFITSEEWLERPGSVGRIRQGTIHICNDDGDDLPPGEEGTIYFSGAGTTYEYYKDAEKTAEASLPGGRTTLGDVGYVDGEGYLYLTDRLAHMIISGGVNIYPREIEDVLVTHPAVVDVAVFGVPHREMGEEVKAVVQRADPAADEAELERELIAHAREHLAPYKCPRSIDFEDELPRLPTGKLYKRLLRDRYWGTTGSRIVG